jgi:hypothetical protein
MILSYYGSMEDEKYDKDNILSYHSLITNN